VSTDVVRLPRGEPERAWGTPAELTVSEQPLDAGSHVRVEGGVAPTGSFTLAVWLLATAPTGGWQAIAASWEGGRPAWGLFLGGGGLVAGYVRTDAGAGRWCSAFLDLTEPAWCHLALVHHADVGRIEVHQLPLGASEPVSVIRELEPGVAAGGELFMLAAAPPSEPGGLHRAHLNGKLARPVVLGAALDAGATAELAHGGEVAGDVLARWDLGARPAGDRAVELSGRARDGLVVGAPSRGVTGPGFAGQPGTLRTDAPDWYDAIHFHDDDLDDAGWAPGLRVDVPAAARSGLYAVRVRHEEADLLLPFAVRPRAPEGRLAFLVPTLTWQAYGSNLAAFSHTEDGVLDRLPCLYDMHSDGSIVYHQTRRKPTRSTDPRLNPPDWGAHAVAADLFLTAWLDELEVGWDALTDEHLHEAGSGGLDGYDCLLLGAHPEYFTRRMQEAVRGFVSGGGRLLYLGGNGMFWVTSIDSARPHLMEVRKTLPHTHSAGAEAPGEAQHSFDDEVGGLWERQDLPPRSLLGVDTATAAFGRHDDDPVGFARTGAASDPRYAWIFEGVDEEPIGAYGANMGSAAGCEMDAVMPWASHDAGGPVLLARATHPSFEKSQRPPVTGPAAADIALMLHQGGGAVFAAASITWGGSLAHNGYDNGVARVSRNVLERFLATPRGQSVAEGVRSGDGG
jgi:N,N-dimethylformamidase